MSLLAMAVDHKKNRLTLGTVCSTYRECLRCRPLPGALALWQSHPQLKKLIGWCRPPPADSRQLSPCEEPEAPKRNGCQPCSTRGGPEKTLHWPENRHWHWDCVSAHILLSANTRRNEQQKWFGLHLWASDSWSMYICAWKIRFCSKGFCKVSPKSHGNLW